MGISNLINWILSSFQFLEQFIDPTIVSGLLLRTNGHNYGTYLTTYFLTTILPSVRITQLDSGYLDTNERG